MRSPLEQFSIIKYIESPIKEKWFDLTFTNVSLYFLLSFFIVIISLILGVGFKDYKVIGTEFRFLFISLYKFILSLIKDILPTNLSSYLPFFFNLFTFILINNIIGLIPYSFTTTSHIIITIFFSLTLIISLTILGFYKFQFQFFLLFVPHGLNKGSLQYIIPFIFFIELLSYSLRILSLSVRLAANMLSGHTLLKISSYFSLSAMSLIKSTYWGYIILPLFSLLPLTFLSAIYILEFGVSFIQSYVFTLLTLLYLKDSEFLH